MGTKTYQPAKERLLITYSNRLLDHIDLLLKLPHLSEDESQILRSLKLKRECTVDELKVVTAVNRKADSEISLQRLLGDAKGVVLPTLDEPKVSPGK